MRGSAPEWSCGQGVPRVNRTVQTRVVLDALVSNKTFGNATSAPTANFLTRSKTSNKIEGSLVSTGTTNELRANRSQCARTSLSILTYPLSRSLMLERREKLKHFFNAFLTGIGQGQDHGILGVSSGVLFAAEPTLFRALPPAGVRGTPGAWSNW